MSAPDPRAELAASLRRRGLPVPRQPYVPAQAPYKRPVPKPLEANGPETRLTDQDRADILAMADAGMPWETIEEEYPAVSTRGLKRIISVGRGKRTKDEDEPGTVGICLDCGQPTGRIRSAKRCLTCARERERERVAEKQRLAAERLSERRCACGEPTRTPRTKQCQACWRESQSRARARQRERYAEKRAARKCPCGAELGTRKSMICLECALRVKAENERRKEAA